MICVRFVDDHQLQVAEHVRPLLVVREEGRVDEVRVGQKDMTSIAELLAIHLRASERTRVRC